MVRLFCSALQVNGETHETMISVFSNEHTTSFMINIKGLELNKGDLDDEGMQLLAEDVARAVEQAQRSAAEEADQQHLRAV